MKKIILLTVLFFCFNVTAQSINIGERIVIQSKHLNDERELLIYTPPSYHFNEKSKYPVLYVVDGDYNFHYVTGLVELLSSISKNIPEMIVVGLSSKGTPTYRKNSKPPYDVKDKGNADKTVAHIKEEVVTYINKNYKTNGYQILAGHSIGGLFTTYAMINNPKFFNSYIAISPALWWEDEALKKQIEIGFKKKQPLPANYYITLANEKGMGVHGFLELLESKGPRSLNLKFKHFPDESHGSVGMASYRWALEDMFADFRVEEGYFKDAKSVESYHKKLQENYQTSLHIAAGFLRSTAYAYSKDKKSRASIGKALAKYFPNQIDEYRNIQIAGLIQAKRLDEARKILVKALRNNKNNFETLANQASLFTLDNKPKDALKAIEKAIAIARRKNIRTWLLNELLDQRDKILVNI